MILKSKKINSRYGNNIFVRSWKPEKYDKIIHYAELGKEISDQDWDNFVYNRKSLRGKHWELWQHLSGCRQWIKVQRDTATHEIFKTLKANEEIS